MTIAVIVKYRVGTGEKSRVYILSRHENIDAAERAASKARKRGYNAFVADPDLEKD